METMIAIILVFFGLRCEDAMMLIAAGLFAIASNISIHINVKKDGDKNNG